MTTKRNILVTHAERVEFNTTAKDIKKSHLCPTCGEPMKYNRKLRKWICEKCLYGAFLTDQAQREAVKRYRESEKGRESEKRYEQSPKGKKTRDKYLKSEKYKAARKRYNEKLKESLRIAREALAGQPKAKAITREERMVPLIDEIKEFIQLSKRSPKASDVIEWAEDEHQAKITETEAQTLIERARRELVT